MLDNLQGKLRYVTFGYAIYDLRSCVTGGARQVNRLAEKRSRRSRQVRGMRIEKITCKKECDCIMV